MSDPSADANVPDQQPPFEPPQLGRETAGAILGLLQDFYRQEVIAEEDVHRTLPFFATALGLIVASLNYSITQLPSWTDVLQSCGQRTIPALSMQTARCAWSVLLTELCLAVVVCLSGAVLWFLALATRRGPYRRVGPEGEIVMITRQLHSYHASTGVTGDDLDKAVLVDLRAQLLEPFADAIESNRKVTLGRYQHRARAVFCLLWSLFFCLGGHHVHGAGEEIRDVAMTDMTEPSESQALPAPKAAATAAQPPTTSRKPSANLTYIIQKGVNPLPFMQG